MHLRQSLHATAELPHPEDLNRFTQSLKSEWIEEALRVHGVATLRRRRLPAEQVIWLVIGMGLFRNRSIAEIVERLDLAMPDSFGTIADGSSAIHAKARLGVEPLQWLLERCGEAWGHASADQDRYRGFALYGIDGTSFRVADSETNRNEFGVMDGGYPDSSTYPVLGLSALMALRSHITIAADFGPYREGEYAHARSLWEHIPHRSLTLLDRGYASGALLYRLHSQGIHRHFLVRVPKTFHGSPEHILGSKDELVNWTLSAKARKAHPDLPERWTVRCIHYRHSDGSEGRLVTSLLDSEQYPAQELIKLYHERWEIELGYGEIKTDMLDQTHTPLRSHTPHGVRQEVWGILIAYNLIRWQMLRVAHRVHVSPLRISFLRVYRLICDEWLWCANAAPGTIPKYLRRLQDLMTQCVLPERRSQRRYLRVVKIKKSIYPKKHRTLAKTQPLSTLTAF